MKKDAHWTNTPIGQTNTWTDLNFPVPRRFCRVVR